jgi:hypothetical protein
MSVQDLTDYEYAHKRLSYDPETGIFTWKEVGPEFFKTKKAYLTWNGRYAGTKAGNMDVTGYSRIGFRGKLHLAHRIAWLMMKAVWPEKLLDHIDGDKTNNMLSNLREVDSFENQRNCPKRKDNSSGVTGVSFRKNSGKWVANISFDGKQKHLGYFDTKESAISARKKAEREYGYHENHGR